MRVQRRCLASGTRLALEAAAPARDHCPPSRHLPQHSCRLRPQKPNCVCAFYTCALCTGCRGSARHWIRDAGGRPRFRAPCHLHLGGGELSSRACRHKNREGSCKGSAGPPSRALKRTETDAKHREEGGWDGVATLDDTHRASWMAVYVLAARTGGCGPLLRRGTGSGTDTGLSTRTHCLRSRTHTAGALHIRGQVGGQRTRRPWGARGPAAQGMQSLHTQHTHMQGAGRQRAPQRLLRRARWARPRPPPAPGGLGVGSAGDAAAMAHGSRFRRRDRRRSKACVWQRAGGRAHPALRGAARRRVNARMRVPLCRYVGPRQRLTRPRQWWSAPQ